MIAPARVLAGGGVAAVVGGLLWVVKGGVILATGEQPAHLFELAPSFLSACVVALAFALPSRWKGRKVALFAAVFGLVAALATAAQHLAGRSSEPWMGLAFLGILVGLLGAAIGGARVRSPGSRYVLAFALAFPLLAFAVPGAAYALGASDAFMARFIDVPIVLLGAGWMALGALMLRVRRAA